MMDKVGAENIQNVRETHNGFVMQGRIVFTSSSTLFQTYSVVAHCAFAYLGKPTKP